MRKKALCIIQFFTRRRNYLSSHIKYTWDGRQNPGHTRRNESTSSHHALSCIIFSITRLACNVTHNNLYVSQYIIWKCQTDIQRHIYLCGEVSRNMEIYLKQRIRKSVCHTAKSSSVQSLTFHVITTHPVLTFKCKQNTVKLRSVGNCDMS
jgi:hypothetical protein